MRTVGLVRMYESRFKAGFSEKEAMEVSGHKTRCVFDRYHIVSDRRLKQLGERLGAHLRRKDEQIVIASEKSNSS